MFTGIVETVGIVRQIIPEEDNLTFLLESNISSELKPDQSVSHNGVCLTVTQVHENLHRVTAVRETLNRTDLADWKINDLINLERCLTLNNRVDGHLVQGHVDTFALCKEIQASGGSWYFHFQFPYPPEQIVVDKGSICINGISLTVVQPEADYFSVAIIPYTWEHTNFKTLTTGQKVNIEFDLIGKYVSAWIAKHTRSITLQ